MHVRLVLAMTLTTALNVTREGLQLSPTMPVVMVGSLGLCQALAPNSPPGRTGTLALGEVTVMLGHVAACRCEM